MIKKTITFASYALAFLGITTNTGCSKDDDLCYKCTDAYDQSYTYCFDDFKNDDYFKEYFCGGSCSEDEFKAYIAMLEGDGYNCTKK